MEIVLLLILSIIGGAVGAFISVRRSKKVAMKYMEEEVQAKNHKSTISEALVQKYLYHPNKGRSIESVRRTIETEQQVAPEFFLICPITVEE